MFVHVNPSYQSVDPERTAAIGLESSVHVNRALPWASNPVPVDYDFSELTLYYIALDD